jgi:hypothetical protein
VGAILRLHTREARTLKEQDIQRHYYKAACSNTTIYDISEDMDDP